MKREKIVVGLSGGVDSATCAHLLKEAGHDVTGIYMRNWQEAGIKHCPVEQDLRDAESCAKHIGIPFTTVDFSQQYLDQVFSAFLEAYQQGYTPNPDVLCNQEIKFHVFQNHIVENYGAKLATGHYACIENSRHGKILLQGIDPTKDQSYFLCRLNQQQLDNALFPIGRLHKHQIREIAKHNGIPVHQKKDSTGICFIGERKFNDFLSQYLLDRPGDIVEKDTGKILGTHHGLIYYTVGQRKGLNIPAKNEQSSPWFVVDKDLATQTLFVAQGEDNHALFNQSLVATQLHWVGEPLLAKNMIGAKIRYRQATQEATITQVEDDRIQISFTVPQRAITPGQYVVLYQKNQLMGSAVIQKAGTW